MPKERGYIAEVIFLKSVVILWRSTVIHQIGLVINLGAVAIGCNDFSGNFVLPAMPSAHSLPSNQSVKCSNMRRSTVICQRRVVIFWRSAFICQRRALIFRRSVFIYWRSAVICRRNMVI